MPSFLYSSSNFPQHLGARFRGPSIVPAAVAGNLPEDLLQSMAMGPAQRTRRQGAASVKKPPGFACPSPRDPRSGSGETGAEMHQGRGGLELSATAFQNQMRMERMQVGHNPQPRARTRHTSIRIKQLTLRRRPGIFLDEEMNLLAEWPGSPVPAYAGTYDAAGVSCPRRGPLGGTPPSAGIHSLRPTGQ